MSVKPIQNRKFMPNRLFILSCIALLNGCTTLSQDECKVANWQSLGYEHGVNGGDYADGITKIATCNDYNITPNIAQFKSSYESGLAVYCQPENGFTLAMRGVSYNGVCNSRAFRKAWEEGNDRYQIQQRRIEIDNRITELKQQLSELNQQLNSNNITQTQRKELNTQQRQLERELKDLRREKSLLPLLNKASTVEITFP